MSWIRIYCFFKLETLKLKTWICLFIFLKQTFEIENQNLK